MHHNTYTHSYMLHTNAMLFLFQHMQMRTRIYTYMHAYKHQHIHTSSQLNICCCSSGSSRSYSLCVFTSFYDLQYMQTQHTLLLTALTPLVISYTYYTGILNRPLAILMNKRVFCHMSHVTQHITCFLIRPASMLL